MITLLQRVTSSTVVVECQLARTLGRLRDRPRAQRGEQLHSEGDAGPDLNGGDSSVTRGAARHSFNAVLLARFRSIVVSAIQMCSGDGAPSDNSLVAILVLSRVEQREHGLLPLIRSVQ